MHILLMGDYANNEKKQTTAIHNMDESQTHGTSERYTKKIILWVQLYEVLTQSNQATVGKKGRVIASGVGEAGNNWEEAWGPFLD